MLSDAKKLKKNDRGKVNWSVGIFTSLSLLLLIAGCKKNEIEHFLNGYEQVNLVSDTPSLHPAHIDPHLVNAWGIAAAPSGPIWISSNNGNVSTVYDKTGNTLIPAVIIPSPGSATGGTPTGIVFNSTSDFSFMVGKATKSGRFIFATEDGTIAAWGGGSTATIVADQSGANAVYKGLAMAKDGASNFLYATNFKQARIDVFDANYNLVTTKPFIDPSIPSGFAPFNIRNIGGWLYVTYARQKPDKHDDLAGPGNGFIDIYLPNGSLVKRFASHGALNSPWGLAPVQAGFSEEASEGAILVGNFGDGRINVYEKDGGFIGPLRDEGRPVTIKGLWAIESQIPGASADQLFFTSGPYEEQHGLFGYLQREKHK